MDYFILTRKGSGATTVSYYCVKNLVRCTYDMDGKPGDFTFFSCSGMPSLIPTAEILAITPATPTGTIEL